MYAALLAKKNANAKTAPDSDKKNYDVLQPSLLASTDTAPEKDKKDIQGAEAAPNTGGKEKSFQKVLETSAKIAEDSLEDDEKISQAALIAKPIYGYVQALCQNKSVSTDQLIYGQGSLDHQESDTTSQSQAQNVPPGKKKNKKKNKTNSASSSVLHDTSSTQEADIQNKVKVGVGKTDNELQFKQNQGGAKKAKKDKSKQICFAFRNGICKRTQCLFSHDLGTEIIQEEENPNQTKKPKQICFAFLKGNCKRTQCLFSHELGSEVNQGEENSLPPSLQQQKDVKDNHIEGDANDDNTGTSKLDLSGATSETDEQRAVCKAFVSGWCNRKMCHLFHPSKSDSNVDARYPNGKAPVWNAGICYDALRGECHREDCYFEHPIHEKSPSNNVENACPVFMVHGKCPNANCSLEHPAELLQNICLSYVQSGMCIFKNCLFDHSFTLVKKDLNVPKQISEAKPNHKQTLPTEKIPEGVCRDFVRGKCQRQNCWYLHSMEEQSKKIPSLFDIKVDQPENINVNFDENNENEMESAEILFENEGQMNPEKDESEKMDESEQKNESDHPQDNTIILHDPEVEWECAEEGCEGKNAGWKRLCGTCYAERPVRFFGDPSEKPKADNSAENSNKPSKQIGKSTEIPSMNLPSGGHIKQQPQQKSTSGRQFNQPPQQKFTPDGQFNQPPQQKFTPGGQFDKPPQQKFPPGGQFNQPPQHKFTPDGQSNQPPQRNFTPGGQFNQPSQQNFTPGGQLNQPQQQKFTPGGQFNQSPQQNFTPGGQFNQPLQKNFTPGGQFNQPPQQKFTPDGQFNQPPQQKFTPDGQFNQPLQQRFPLRGQINHHQRQDFPPGGQLTQPPQPRFNPRGQFANPQQQHNNFNDPGQFSPAGQNIKRPLQRPPFGAVNRFSTPPKLFNQKFSSNQNQMGMSLPPPQQAPGSRPGFDPKFDFSLPPPPLGKDMQPQQSSLKRGMQPSGRSEEPSAKFGRFKGSPSYLDELNQYRDQRRSQSQEPMSENQRNVGNISHRRKQPCFNFQKGSCYKGDSCLFEHVYKREICWKFQQGQCRNLNCNFDHVTPEEMEGNNGRFGEDEREQYPTRSSADRGDEFNRTQDNYERGGGRWQGDEDDRRDDVQRRRDRYPSDDKYDPWTANLSPEGSWCEVDLVAQKVTEATTPLVSTPYPEQLMKKEREVNLLLEEIEQEILEYNPDAKLWIKRQQQQNYGRVAKIERMKESPVLEGYRNKCEFSIGINPKTMKLSVGFKLDPRAGDGKVGPVYHLKHVPAQMKTIVRELESFIQRSGQPAYSQDFPNTGGWLSAVLRLTQKEEIMLIVNYVAMSTHPRVLRDLKDDLRRYFSEDYHGKYKLTSLYFCRKNPGTPGSLEHLFGAERITEALFGLELTVSPRAYLCINTYGAELLYETISQMLGVNNRTVLLDICCGTGSIGLCLANWVDKVIGLDLSADAISDAKRNAIANCLKNTEFRAGSVEDTLEDAVCGLDATEIDAILDPPRAGLPVKAIRVLRGIQRIRKLVFVANDPRSSFKNLVDLTRPTSTMFLGDPFMPMLVSPVDLFPHTSHYFTLILFVRVSSAELQSSFMPKPCYANSRSAGPGFNPVSRGRLEPTVSRGGMEPPSPPRINAEFQRRSRGSSETGLSAEQKKWLDDMERLYEKFDRSKWVKTFAAQNHQAALKQGSAVAVEDLEPPPPPRMSRSPEYDGNQSPEFDEDIPPMPEFPVAPSTSDAKAYAVYKEKYKIYSDWYEMYGHKYKGDGPKNRTKIELPDPGNVPPGTDSQAWKKYCQETKEYWDMYSESVGPSPNKY